MNVMLVSLFDVTPVDKTRPMRYLSMANVFLSNGVSVEYVSNTFRHATKKHRVAFEQTIESSNGLRTTYLNSLMYSSNTSIRRFVSHFMYALNLRKYLVSLSEEDRPDIIISAMPPLIANLVLLRWAKRNNLKFFLDVIDPWPDVFTKFLPSWFNYSFGFILLPYRLAAKYLVIHSTGISSISFGYIKWAKRLGGAEKVKKTHVAYPSINLSEYIAYMNKNSSAAKRSNSKTLNLVYAGNFGLSYDLPCILKAAEWFNVNYPGKTRFILAGEGHYKSFVKKEEEKLTNVEYVGRVGYDELMQLYAQSHLGLAQYRQNATQTFTYKFFDYLGAGLPLLNSLESETWDLISKEKLGCNNKPGDYLSLAKNIESFFDRERLKDFSSRAIYFTREHGNSDIVYKDYLGFISSL